jgi:NitT/TauT family transport system substrate-binding protein
VNSHYSIPPFLQIVLKSPNVRSVLKSMDTLGGPATVTNAWANQRFIEANPIKAKALVAALDEASEMIAQDPKRSAEIYLDVTKEKITVDELVAILKAPGAVFTALPQRSMLYGDYMHRIGLIKTKPASWKEYTFPLIHDRPGS